MKIPGVTFSWKQALGISQAKQRITKEIGIPLTENGLERIIGSLIVKTLFKNKMLIER